MKSNMKIIPLELRDANEFVAAYHRHHKPCVGHRFSIGVIDQTGKLRGVAIIGRPVARMIDQSKVVEVLRLTTDGHFNACSKLYGASARIAREMGYERIQTYILESETGVSLKAAGWLDEGAAGGGNGWLSRPGRRSDQPTMLKNRYVKDFGVT